MAKFKVVEMFTSINGEGTRAGQLAVFVRLQGCNLNCSYCDTTWANEADAPFEWMDEEQIVAAICKTGVVNVTLTGGEPLLHENIEVLLKRLAQENNLSVEIETNGSVSIAPFDDMLNRPRMTMDYKSPSSGMEAKMLLDNFSHLKQMDTVKFVCGSLEDLQKAKEIINKYRLVGRCHVYLSPVFGNISPDQMVQFMIEHNLNGVNLQLQLHKFIWDPNERGV